LATTISTELKSRPTFCYHPKKKFLTDTQKSRAISLCNGQFMFELGKPPGATLSDSLLALPGAKAAPMTLTDNVRALFQQLRGPVFRYLLRWTQNAGQAEDLTQETFLRLFRHLQKEGSLENPKAWLFTVAHNLAIDTNRDEANLTDLDESTWREIERSRPGPQADPEKIILQNERLDRLHVAVLNLTSLQRQCLHLRADGLRYREIADLLGLSISTVVDAVRRATVKLAKEFGNEVAG
jgi:RNA polymerase sigma-70 factor (ECF subfamily)